MSWKVTEQPTIEPVDLQRAKDHLRVDGSHDDALIESLVSASREWAEGYIDRAIAEQEITLKLDQFSDLIYLPFTHLISVEEVSYTDRDGVDQTLSTDVYGVDAFSHIGSIFKKKNQSWPDTKDDKNVITIRYRAGLEIIPSDIQSAMLLMVGSLYDQRQEGVIGTITATAPVSAQRLLNRYRRLGV